MRNSNAEAISPAILPKQPLVATFQQSYDAQKERQRKSKASSASPITLPILATGITVILSIAICETSRSPLRSDGSTSSRN